MMRSRLILVSASAALLVGLAMCGGSGGPGPVVPGPTGPIPKAGDRILLVVEAAPGSMARGQAQLSTPDGTMDFRAFQSPEPLRLVPRYAGELYLVSEPLTDEQAQKALVLAKAAAGTQVEALVTMELYVAPGALARDDQSRAGVYAALWQTVGDDVEITGLFDLGRPMEVIPQ